MESKEGIFEYIFSQQSLGIVLRRSHNGLVFISKIVDENIKEKGILQDGDILYSASDRIVPSNFSKEKWKELVDFIRKAPRPLVLTFRKPKHDNTTDLNLGERCHLKLH